MRLREVASDDDEDADQDVAENDFLPSHLARSHKLPLRQMALIKIQRRH